MPETDPRNVPSAYVPNYCFDPIDMETPRSFADLTLYIQRSIYQNQSTSCKMAGARSSLLVRRERGYRSLNTDFDHWRIPTATTL